MDQIIIIVEHDNTHMHANTYNVLAAALQFNQSVKAVVIGYNCNSVAEEVSQLQGISCVWLADNINYQHLFAETISALIINNYKNAAAILAPASTFGKNFLPRVAAGLNVTQVSDVTRILEEDIFEHPIYAGNAIETVQVFDPIKVLTIRVTAFNPCFNAQSPCEIIKLAAIHVEHIPKLVKEELSKAVRPDLSCAKIVVAGGRGLKDKENFKLIEELADVLGAGIGASRAAVDAGFIANDYQVGQTGKVVAPTLYFAIGISGAIQHIAGMKESKIIVAINKDKDAPIFQVANYGLVGDLFELVPILVQELKNKTRS